MFYLSYCIFVKFVLLNKKRKHFYLVWFEQREVNTEGASRLSGPKYYKLSNSAGSS